MTRAEIAPAAPRPRLVREAPQTRATRQELIGRLKAAVGGDAILTREDEQAFYTKGFRVGGGKAAAVVLPGTLTELWTTLQTCVNCDAAILMQGSNTGVTGGSTPDGDDYDRELVIVSTRRIKGVQLLDDGKQVIAFPGSTLTELENALKPLHREPHSVIGSSCIGASVVGGICNNSGGSLMRRGPAFTEKSLFAEISPEGELSLVNHLGIHLGSSPEEILSNIEKGNYTVGDAPGWEGRIWADDYAERLRDVDADSPARFNGNPRYLHDSAGCAGKLAVFAVRLPSFAAPETTTTFYIGTNAETELVELRRLLLQKLQRVPIQAEYIHRDAFDLTLRYSRHVYKAIRFLGAEKIPALLAEKARWDKILRRLRIFPRNTVDKVLQLINAISGKGVPRRFLQYRQRFEHYLMIKTEGQDAAETERLLHEFFRTRTGEYFRCDDDEARDAFLVRFAVGGCTINYCDYAGIDTNQRLLAFDVALRRNDTEWRLKLPATLREQVLLESCCGHFFCFVNHQDYILKPGVDAVAFKHRVLEYLDTRGARYPAEHNVGHLYHAPSDYEEHMRRLDPTNSFNPGVGKTTKKKFWRQ